MKHIKLYENFDWAEEDFDYEETVDIPNDLFKKFLIDNNIYDEFIYEFNKPRSIEWRLQTINISNIKEYIESIPPIWFISSAFIWYYTDKGEKYWNTLNTKWNKSL